MIKTSKRKGKYEKLYFSSQVLKEKFYFKEKLCSK